MSTKFASVRAAIFALLQTYAGALGAATVENGRVDPFTKDELPAINLVPGAHQQLDGGIDFDVWSFEIDIEINTHGATAYADADSIVAQLAPLITGAASVKALAYGIRNDGGGRPETVGADFIYQQQTITYRFECQTALNSLV